MRKLMLVSMMLTVALATQAQLGRKVAPQMEKGLVKTFTEKQVTTMTGQQPVTITNVAKYTVADTTDDGFLVDIVNNNVKSDAQADNIAGQFITASAEMMDGLVIRVVTDKEGKILKIADYAALSKQIDKRADETAAKMLKAMPQMEQALPKDALKAQIMEECGEQTLLATLQQNASSAMMLNGKTIMTGAQESYVDQKGIKMKRMYFVNGDNITVSSNLDMTKDELKALIIAKVEQSIPDQAAMIKQNIDQLMDSGMLKLEMKESATYELQADGWVKTIKVETTSDSLGQQAKFSTEVTAIQ